ncbi:MAG: two-component sensor histidine kinase [Anaerolinea sp.]|nr:two-component sensor histidine kinase [Anaerolinea sp.]
MKRFKTLRMRFTLWIAGLMLLVLVIFGTFVYISLRQGLANSIDDSLKLSTSQAIAAVNIENGQINFSDSLPENSTTELRERGLTIRVLKPNGQLIESVGPYQNLGVDNTTIQIAAAGNSSFSTIYFNESNPIRIYTAPIFENGKLVGIIQVMQSLSNLHETLDRLLLELLISIPILLIVSALCGYLLAARALAPIDQIIKTAQRISTEDLSARLNLQGNDDEIGRLATTFDNMLSRLEKGFIRERQFTSDASHELRTPLAAMQAILNVTRERKRPPEEYEIALDDLSEETDRLRALTEDLLYIARGDSRPGNLNEVINISNIVIDVSESLRPLVETKGLSIEYNVQGDQFILGDSDALIRAFVNLLDNAIKYTEKGGITISTKRIEDKSIEILISDTGRGIAEKYLPHIFERFYRVDESRTTKGFGLGLAIVYEIIKTNQGTIEASSQIGTGSVFRLQFPLVN